MMPAADFLKPFEKGVDQAQIFELYAREWLRIPFAQDRRGPRFTCSIFAGPEQIRQEN
jgi:hypothetical protein